jgi:putative glycosyltransferase
MDLSIVTTLYYSEPYVREFYERVSDTARKITDDYEIIFVNDGSPDNALETALGLYEKDPRIKIVDFSRNFGHHKAVMTGLAYAKGDIVFLIDSDLEERPELLETFWKEMMSSRDVDVVYGQQGTRRGNWFERTSGKVFYKIFNSLSTTRVPENVLTARLMKKNYVDALLRYKEQELFLAGVWAAAGFNQKSVRVEKMSHSPTTYSIARKTSILVNSVTSFTDKPLVYIFYLGSAISFVAFLLIGYLLFKRIFLGVLAGWTSVIASIWLVGGIVVFSIGVLGVYIAKIFIEVKDRPYTIVKKYYSRGMRE